LLGGTPHMTTAVVAVALYVALVVAEHLAREHGYTC
jgi:hypothetical protein